MHPCHQLCSREIGANLARAAEVVDPQMHRFMAQVLRTPDVFQFEFRDTQPAKLDDWWLGVQCQHDRVYWVRPGKRHRGLVQKIDAVVTAYFTD